MLEHILWLEHIGTGGVCVFVCVSWLWIVCVEAYGIVWASVSGEWVCCNGAGKKRIGRVYKVYSRFHGMLWLGVKTRCLRVS